MAFAFRMFGSKFSLCLLPSVVCWLFANSLCQAADGVPAAFFKKHCYECHGQDAEEGRIRLDPLPATFETKQQVEHWNQVFEKIESRSMPPKKRMQPTAVERQQALAVDRRRTVGGQRRPPAQRRPGGVAAVE